MICVHIYDTILHNKMKDTETQTITCIKTITYIQAIKHAYNNLTEKSMRIYKNVYSNILLQYDRNLRTDNNMFPI